ncbi:unnamed protein product [Natator depressus]
MSYCWGAGSCGQLGLGEAAAGGPVRCRRGPEAGGGQTLLEAACGERHTLLLRPDGTVCSCGANARGQLGRRLRPGQRPPPRSYTPGKRLGSALPRSGRRGPGPWGEAGGSGGWVQGVCAVLLLHPRRWGRSCPGSRAGRGGAGQAPSWVPLGICSRLGKPLPLR